MQPKRGEVWLFDLGMAAKTRPVLVVSVAYGDADRAIVTVVPHTTQLRGSPFEISVRVPFLQPGAFVVQGISTYPNAWAIRKIGALSRDQMGAVMAGLLNWLGAH
jgi:mRNA interferase MazF